ncbi:MAG TPA: aldo/keto reductase [Ktedonobacteraceae bacterium]|jgi:aryl-alcohol dehydrogenase-like predicted oxidoreductase
MLATRRLGQSDLWITAVGIGTAPMGSTPDWRIYWGVQDERESLRAIEVALDLGVNWIDTAPFYGWGRAEALVGRALRGKRAQVAIFTKCGTVRNERGEEREDLTPASIRREVEESLRRLRTEYIDLYQFHDPDPSTPLETSWETMDALIQEGKVRYAGLSNHPPDLMQRALAVAPIAASQHQYSLLAREIERAILPFARRSGIGVLAWSPLASGFLTDRFAPEMLDPQDFRRQHPFAREEAWSKLRQIRQGLLKLARVHGHTLTDLAIAWLLHQPGLTGAIMGIRTEQDARTMAHGLDWTLSEQERQEIERLLAAWN